MTMIDSRQRQANNNNCDHLKLEACKEVVNLGKNQEKIEEEEEDDDGGGGGGGGGGEVGNACKLAAASLKQSMALELISRRARRRGRRRTIRLVTNQEQEQELELEQYCGIEVIGIENIVRHQHEQQTHPQRHKSARLNITPARILLVVASLAPLLLVIIFTALPADGVDCFKCSSRNGSNPACEDPFHNLNTTKVNIPIMPDPQPSVIYHTPCYAGRKNRDGLFPASACIKLTGVFDTTGETLVVRHCALDSGSLTQDTELARMSHCGKFQFEGDLLRGCVLACPEDACNAAHQSTTSFMNSSVPIFIIWLLLTSVLVARLNCRVCCLTLIVEHAEF